MTSVRMVSALPRLNHVNNTFCIAFHCFCWKKQQLGRKVSPIVLMMLPYVARAHDAWIVEGFWAQNFRCITTPG